MATSRQSGFAGRESLQEVFKYPVGVVLRISRLAVVGENVQPILRQSFATALAAIPSSRRARFGSISRLNFETAGPLILQAPPVVSIPTSFAMECKWANGTDGRKRQHMGVNFLRTDFRRRLQ